MHSDRLTGGSKEGVGYKDTASRAYRAVDNEKGSFIRKPERFKSIVSHFFRGKNRSV